MPPIEGTKCRFRHNGDFSGDVEIQTQVKGARPGELSWMTALIVPSDDIKILVSAWARHTHTTIIENATGETVRVKFGQLEHHFSG